MNNGYVDLQKMFDSMMKLQTETRKKYHLSLGDLVDALNKADKNLKVFASYVGEDVCGIEASACSYRGYYSDLAINPTSVENACTVGKLL